MIDRKQGKVVFICEVCGDDLNSGQDDFRAAREVLRTCGWHSRKIELAWWYTCTKCGLPGERAPLARNARLAAGRASP